VFTNFYAHISIHACRLLRLYTLYTLTNVYAHIRPIHIDIPFGLHNYLFTTFYAHISIHVYVILQPTTKMCLYISMPYTFAYTCLHTSTSINNLNIFTYIYAHRAILHYVLLLVYTHTNLDPSTPIYLNMFSYFFAYIPIYIYTYS
jgi:hypothetical protein